MTAKEWLQRGWKLDQEINALEEAKTKAYSRCISITTHLKDIPEAHEGNSTSDDKLVAYADFCRTVDERIDQLVAVKQEILKVINQVGDQTLRTLLLRRYIVFQTWEQIAVDMNYSYQHICRLHGIALEKVKHVIECYTKQAL